MKINLIEVPKPMFTEYSLFASPDIELLKRTKVVRVSPSCHTKTRVYTNMQIGNSRNGINFQVEGFKTFEQREHSYFSGEIQVTNYFVKSKKQNIEAYKEYVKKVVEIAIREYLKVDLDEVTIELEVGNF
jgi:hypothetical protein